MRKKKTNEEKFHRKRLAVKKSMNAQKPKNAKHEDDSDLQGQDLP